MEDFGAEGIVSDGAPVPERYRAAVEVLAAIHDATASDGNCRFPTAACIVCRIFPARRCWPRSASSLTGTCRTPPVTPLGGDAATS